MCKSCNKIAGHNSRTCKQRLHKIDAKNATTYDQADQQEDMTKRRLCSICNKIEKHNARTCPKREEAKDEEDEEEDDDEEDADEEEKKEYSDEEDDADEPEERNDEAEEEDEDNEEPSSTSKGRGMKKTEVGKHRSRTGALQGITSSPRRKQMDQQTLNQL